MHGRSRDFIMMRKVLSIPLYIGFCLLLIVAISWAIGRPWKGVVTSPYTIIGLTCGTITYCAIVFGVPWLRRKLDGNWWRKFCRTYGFVMLMTQVTIKMSACSSCCPRYLCCLYFAFLFTLNLSVRWRHLSSFVSAEESLIAFDSSCH